MKNETTTLTRTERIIKWFNENCDADIDFSYHIKQMDEINSFDEIRDELDESGAFNVEIIYYSNAIDYLKEHDSSLNKSLGIARDMGFDIKGLNSEVLASLLASQKCREEFEESRIDFENFLSELDEEEEEKESEE